MTKIDEYFYSLQKDIEARFTRMRNQNSDSEAKGVASEKIIGELLEPYLQPTRVTYRRQIIDSHGNASDEVDVVFCNLSQPRIETELLLAEGVDYAVQVKSVLTDIELDRLIVNAHSVKRLQRHLGIGEFCFGGDFDATYIDKVPYIGVAYESQLSFETLHERLVSKCTALQPDLQPDALFVIGRGSFVNSRGKFCIANKSVAGWIGIPDPATVLLELLNFLIGHVPCPVRTRRILHSYLAKSSAKLKPREGMTQP